MNEVSGPVSEDPEFIRLVDGFLDNRLSAAEMKRLEDVLNSNPAAIDECARRMKVHAEFEEACDPMQLELRQDRRTVIQGHGDSQRVVVRETQTAHLGNSRSSAMLTLSGPEAPGWWSLQRLALMVPLLLAAVIAVVWFWPEKDASGSSASMDEAEIGTTVSSPVWTRRPKNDEELRFWLENMVARHGYSLQEVEAATGMKEEEVSRALDRFGIRRMEVGESAGGGTMAILPYPGGRHTRLQGLNLAINPQRDTKVSVFTPWAAQEYVVVDLPEALRADEGFLYLAHTDVPTIWTKMNLHLRPLEWSREANGRLSVERDLPDGSAFGATIELVDESVRMELWVTNGTLNPFKNVRGQVCVLPARVEGFADLDPGRGVIRDGYTLGRNAQGDRWMITSWHRLSEQIVRTFPCLHADAKFGDCAPGETVRARGWLSFYEGEDLDAELERIEATGWRED